MANPFVHVELQTNDVKRAREFYSKLFDWKLEDMPMAGFGTYTTIGVGEGTGGGMMTSPEKGTPPHWMAYVQVDDIAAATRKAKELGAKIYLDVTAVADMGQMSIVTDPTGASLGLWQPKKR